MYEENQMKQMFKRISSPGRTIGAAMLLAATSVGMATAAIAQDATAPAAATSAAIVAPATAASTAMSGTVTPVAPPMPQATTETVNNPYGFDAVWKSGDVVLRGVVILLLIMSGSTWYIMFAKLIDQTKLMRQAKEAESKFWSAPTVPQGLDALKKGTPFWYIAERGLTATQHHEGTMVERIALSEWITMSIARAAEQIQSKLQGGLAVLATVGSTAPFVGLFGTVWGIYHALTAIALAGQASIDKVAGPVGEALITTALGLAVAVPAVMGYNWLVRRNKAAMEKVRSYSSDLHAVLLSGTRVGEAGAIEAPAS